ncbi:MAG: peptide chain release factor N(5)-glutamine methyltransferase [Candidatus Limnocylindrales bacterium]
MPSVHDLLEPAVARLRAAGSTSARLDAELLLGHVLGIDRTAVLAHPEAPVGTGQVAAFEAAVVRREAGEPVAYIRGVKEFYGLALRVDGRALIPRPETELLVELARDWLTTRLTAAPRGPDAAPVQVLDVGTGSGAIAVALAVVLRRRGYGSAVRFTASDVSPDALHLAVENAVGHGVADVIDFQRADLLDGPGVGDGPASSWAARADLVLANLPYIPSAVLPSLPVAASFEPALALDGGPDGLALLRRLLTGLPAALTDDGCALLEIGGDQAAAARAAAADAVPGWAVRVHDDLGGSPRVLEIAQAATPA